MKGLTISIFLICFCLIAEAQSGVYFGQTISSSINVSNSTIDTLIIDSCEIKNISGFGVKFKNLTFVHIKNSVFRNLSDGGIIGSGTDNVLIENCQFDSITNIAIQLFHITDSNGKIEIINNDISNVYNLTPETGKAIRIYNADSVFILNNRISYCESSGISIGRNYGNQAQQKVDYLLIDNNDISFTMSDGIGTQENITTAIATNNAISNVAYDGTGERLLEGDHGIYWQAPDGIIEGNEIYNILDSAVQSKSGVGISVRTSVKVLRNKVYNCQGRGIAYFNDHPKGSEPLLIANNIIYDNKFNGVYVNGSNVNIIDPNQVSKPNTVLIYNNTIINEPIQDLWHHSCPIAINDMQGIQKVNGNILIYEGHLDTTQMFWHSSNISVEEYYLNIRNNVDIGFVDFVNRNLNLTDVAVSAIEKIPESQAYVTSDFYGNQRTGNHEVGAIEFFLFTNAYPLKVEKCNFIVYPNPVSEILTIDVPCKIQDAQISLHSIDGKSILNTNLNISKNSIKLNLSHLPNGFYVLKTTQKTRVIDSQLIIKTAANKG